MKALATTIISTILLSGCSAFIPQANMDDLSLDDRRKVQSMPIYNEAQLKDKKYKILNVVEGISCKNKLWNRPATKTNSILQSKYWAYMMGADAILNIQCEKPRKTKTTYNCWESITCTAQAIKFD